MEFQSALPIYLQVMTRIKHGIVSGEIALGQKLPSVRDMALSFAINPNTASRVYRELELEGLCFTKRGMGTFVTEEQGVVEKLKEEMAEELTDRFLEGMKQLGISLNEAIIMIKRRE